MKKNNMMMMILMRNIPIILIIIISIMLSISFGKWNDADGDDSLMTMMKIMIATMNIIIITMAM